MLLKSPLVILHSTIASGSNDVITSTDFVDFAVTQKQISDFTDITSGNAEISVIGNCYVDLDM